jgi:16S rRNA (cytosine967-C5)-methyltransferase
MTPAARVQAAIDILDLVIVAARSNGAPADRIVTDWFRTRRFAGSGDRRAVRELVFRAIRACGDIPANGRAAMLLLASDDAALAGLFDGSRHAPESIRDGEQSATPGIAPPWLAERLAASGIEGEEAKALLDRAPLDIRVNALKVTRESLALPVPAEPTQAQCGLRLPAGTPVESWDAFRDGLVEVQDTASQLVVEALSPQPGEFVIDLCAGAGGKTLAIAAAMGNRGRIVACDTDRTRLGRLAPRAERAGVSIVETLLLNPGQELAGLEPCLGKADAVLVDAPCSGTGTWRRNPEARWRLDPAGLERINGLQSRLLDVAARLVKPGGRIVYAVCSLLDCEGPERVAGFLADSPDWRVDPPLLPTGLPHDSGIRLSPSHDGTDGFYIARILAIC